MVKVILFKILKLISNNAQTDLKLARKLFKHQMFTTMFKHNYSNFTGWPLSYPLYLFS